MCVCVLVMLLKGSRQGNEASEGGKWKVESATASSEDWASMPRTDVEKDDQSFTCWGKAGKQASRHLTPVSPCTPLLGLSVSTRAL